MTTHVVVIEELANNGDLFNYIKRQPLRRIDEREGRLIFRQLIEAIMVGVLTCFDSVTTIFAVSRETPYRSSGHKV